MNCGNAREVLFQQLVLMPKIRLNLGDQSCIKSLKIKFFKVAFDEHNIDNVLFDFNSTIFIWLSRFLLNSRDFHNKCNIMSSLHK